MITRFYKILNKNGDVVYIGVTTRTINERFREHIISKGLNRKDYSVVEFDSIEHPEIISIEIYYKEKQRVAELERKYIKEAKLQGYDILNISDGGEWCENILSKLRKEKFLAIYGSYDNYKKWHKKIYKIYNWLNHWQYHRSTPKIKSWILSWKYVRTHSKTKQWIRHWYQCYTMNKTKRWLYHWKNYRSKNRTQIWLHRWYIHKSNSKLKTWLSHWKFHKTENKSKQWLRQWLFCRKMSKSKLWVHNWLINKSYNATKRWLYHWKQCR